jgi:hypothetical protein
VSCERDNLNIDPRRRSERQGLLDRNIRYEWRVRGALIGPETEPSENTRGTQTFVSSRGQHRNVATSDNDVGAIVLLEIASPTGMISMAVSENDRTQVRRIESRVPHGPIEVRRVALISTVDHHETLALRKNVYVGRVSLERVHCDRSNLTR